MAFRPLRVLRHYFATAGLPAPRAQFFQVPTERDGLVARAFPANDDRALLRQMIDDSVDGDRMGMNARRVGDSVHLAYPSVILTSRKT